MQDFKFYKYQGTGNDFVMIDNRRKFFPAYDAQYIAHLCHRRYGIGADGLILLEEAEGYDFRMVYFNANGKEGSMCGNGGRCTVKFAQCLGLFSEKTRFIAVDGAHEAFIKDSRVHLKMNDVENYEPIGEDFFLDTGSPHYVQYQSNLEEFAVYEEGREIRYNERFEAQGTNVNFIEPISLQHLKVRTYERGVEDETYSCGTGVTACAIVQHIKQGASSPIRLTTKGGELAVSFEKKGQKFTNIYLVGAAEYVFQGEVALSH